MRRFCRHLHLWLSIPLGVLIVLICTTGAALVFEKEISAAVQSDLRRAIPDGRAPLPLQQLIPIIERGLDDGVQVSSVEISGNPLVAYKVYLTRPARAAVWVDQYSGQVKGDARRLPFFSTVVRLHRWLGQSHPADNGIWWGKRIIGVTVLGFVLILVSGVVIWWPRNRHQLAASLRIPLRSGAFRFWHGIHIAGGIYIVVLLASMALTGLTWSYDWYGNAFYQMFTESADSHHSRDNDCGYAAWNSALVSVRESCPDKTLTVSNGKVNVSLGTPGNFRAADTYYYDNNGSVTSILPYADSSARAKARGWVYTIHTGRYLGIWSQLLTIIAALLGATLPVSGYYLWLHRRH